MRAARLLIVAGAIQVALQIAVYADVSHPQASRPVIIYGDTRSSMEVHRKIVGEILRREPEAVFHTGDLVGNGLKQRHWENFNAITRELRKKTEFYPALGNHERNSPLYFDNFDLPGNERWYTVQKGGIHFIVLDSNSDLGVGSLQYSWLETSLRDVSKKGVFIVVVFHHPPFSTCTRKEDEKGLRRSVVPLFEKHGVHAVFNGHGHCYERGFKNGVYYFVTGGGGARLRNRYRSGSYSQVYVRDYHYCEVRLREGKLVVHVYDLASDLIDHREIGRGKTP